MRVGGWVGVGVGMWVGVLVASPVRYMSLHVEGALARRMMTRRRALGAARRVPFQVLTTRMRGM